MGNKRTGEELHEERIAPRFRGYSDWMVWGAISSKGKGPLVFFEKDWGTTNDQIYREKIPPYILEYRSKYKQCVLGGRSLPLIEDRSRVHTAQAVQQEWQWHGLNRIWFPANSPDSNPIKNIWKKLKDAVAQRRPSTKEELWAMLEEEWNKIDLSKLQRLVYSMKA